MPSTRCWLLALAVALLPALAGAADSYQYDEVGNLQTLTNDTGTRTYTYDEVNRLDQETGPAGARDHAYDLNGNRSTDGAGTSATFTASTDRLATINGTAVSLDAAGNLTSDGTYAYTWDAAGRLKTVSRANKLWATYYYDYKSRRTRKETTSRAPQGAQVVVYHYDQDDNLLAETLATGAPIKTYIWDDGRLVGLLDHGTTPPTLLTLDLDQLGTPRAARNAQGTVVWRWNSDGYGTTLPNEDPDGNGQKTTINLRFPGQYYDQESGLHYNWNRYYSPRLGRYISADPIGLAGGVNTYSYVSGNPVSNTDPTGLLTLSEIATAVSDATGGCGSDSFVNDVVNNFAQVQEDTSLLKTGTSLAFGGAFAKQYGGLTIGGAATGLAKEIRSGFTVTGIGARTFAQAAGTAAGTWAINSVLIKGSYDAGVLAGSVLRTGINRLASGATCGCNR